MARCITESRVEQSNVFKLHIFTLFWQVLLFYLGFTNITTRNCGKHIIVKGMLLGTFHRASKLKWSFLVLVVRLDHLVHEGGAVG